MKKKPMGGWKPHYQVVVGVGIFIAGLFLSQGKSLTWIGMVVAGALLAGQAGWQLYKQSRPQ